MRAPGAQVPTGPGRQRRHLRPPCPGLSPLICAEGRVTVVSTILPSRSRGTWAQGRPRLVICVRFSAADGDRVPASRGIGGRMDTPHPAAWNNAGHGHACCHSHRATGDKEAALCGTGAEAQSPRKAPHCSLHGLLSLVPAPEGRVVTCQVSSSEEGTVAREAHSDTAGQQWSRPEASTQTCKFRAEPQAHRWQRGEF